MNKVVTLLRFWAKGHLGRAGDAVLALPPYCYYIASSVSEYLKKCNDYDMEANNFLRVVWVSGCTKRLSVNI